MEYSANVRILGHTIFEKNLFNNGEIFFGYKFIMVLLELLSCKRKQSIGYKISRKQQKLKVNLVRTNIYANFLEKTTLKPYQIKGGRTMDN